jgi:hypothetical protein
MEKIMPYVNFFNGPRRRFDPETMFPEKLAELLAVDQVDWRGGI